MASQHAALVTGGAGGLGKAFTEVLLKRGFKVCIADIDIETGKGISDSFNEQYGKDATFFIQFDAQQTESFKRMFEEAERQFGKLDVVINNAGIINEIDWSKTVDINLKAVIQGSLLAIDSMRTDRGGRGGHIINVGSMAGYMPFDDVPVYTATKHAVVGLSRSLDSPRNQQLGIKISCLCPGFVNTNLLKLTAGMNVSNQEKELFDEDVQKYGALEASDVAAALEKLLDNKSDCRVLEVQKDQGTSFVPFQQPATVPCD